MPQSIKKEVYWEGAHLDPIKPQSKKAQCPGIAGSASVRDTGVHVVRVIPYSRFTGSHFPLRRHQKETRGTDALEAGLAATPSPPRPAAAAPPGPGQAAARPGSPPAAQLYRRLAGRGPGPPPPAGTQGPETAPGPPRAFPHITSPLGLRPAPGLQLGGAGGRGRRPAPHILP